MYSLLEEIMKTINHLVGSLNRYPVLWVLYPVLLLFPIVLLIALCVRPSSSQSSNRTSIQNSSGRQSNIRTKNNTTSSEIIESNDAQISKTNINLNSKGPTRNIIRRGHQNANGPVQDDVEQEVEMQQWNFPPTLDEFNLMDSDVDPSMLEEMFTDKKLIQVVVRLSPGQGLGLAIVGGRGSSNGDVPIYVKRILPESVLQKESKIKTGDELIAVNDVILVNSTKEYATQSLSNVEGTVRLLAMQEL